MSATSTGRLVVIPTARGRRFARFWGTEGDPVIAALHGIESHAGWFGPWGARLASRRISLLVLDRQGSGADLAPRGSSPGVDAWLGDVDLVTKEASRLSATTEVHLLGHSWGAKCVALAMLEGKLAALIRSVLLLTPGLFWQDPEGLSAATNRRGAAPAALAQQFDIPLADEQFSDAPEVLASLADDPLRLRQISMRFVLDDAHLSRRIARQPAADAVTVPVWLGLAGGDRIVDAAATRAWFRSLAPDGRCVDFASAGHLVLLERPEELADRVHDWLQELV